jgi:phosphomannomutase/phosphoglucomutase
VIAKDKIFREYDIRGEYGVDFNPEFAKELGLAIAYLVKEAKTGDLVAVGNDCRLSADVLVAALSEGLQQGGVNVLKTGMGPTPQLYYSVCSKNLAGGIQITASHNPGPDNGFKIMIGQKTLSGPDIQKIKKIIFEKQAKVSDKPGTIESFDARSAYLEELVKRSESHVGKRKIKVVVDGGNGVGGLIGPELLRRLGCEVIEIFTDPDGTFPNHHPDPTVLENLVDLQAAVLKEKADLGIAWDGDADRIGVVDEKAQPIYGDMLVVLYGRQLLKEVSHPTIIGDVKCSNLMFEDLNSKGANAVMSKTGHSLIKAKLKELNAQLAGEMSGHMFFAHRYYGFDDAMHASARLIEIVSNTDSSVSELLSDLPVTVSTPEIRMDCPDEIKFMIADKARELFSGYEVSLIDGIRVTFPKGWGLVRASNTQPALVMRFEAENSELLAEYRSIMESKIAEVRKTLA